MPSKEEREDSTKEFKVEVTFKETNTYFVQAKTRGEAVQLAQELWATGDNGYDGVVLSRPDSLIGSRVVKGTLR